MNALLSRRLVKLIKIHPVVERKVHPMSTTSRTAKLCSMVCNCIPFGCFTTQGTFRKASRKIKCKVAVSKNGWVSAHLALQGRSALVARKPYVQSPVPLWRMSAEPWTLTAQARIISGKKKSSSYSGYSSLRAGMVTTSGCPTNRKKSKYKTFFFILWLTGLLWMVVNRILWYMAFVGTVDDLNVDFSHHAFLL